MYYSLESNYFNTKALKLIKILFSSRYEYDYYICKKKYIK